MHRTVVFLKTILLILAMGAIIPLLSSSAASASAAPKKEAAKEEPAKETEAPEDGAEEEAAPVNPGLFSPDYCDFEMTFPERPAITEKCVPGASCFTLNTYTMVYDLQTTVDISVNCTPSTPANQARYKENVMRAALEGMAKQKGLKDYEIQYDTMEGVKNAVLTGVGIRGTQEEIFISQLWIGKNSVFTVQAELIGTAHPVADKAFRDILASIKFKEGKQIPAPVKRTMKTNR